MIEVEIKELVPKLRFKQYEDDWNLTSLSQRAEVIDCKHRTPPYVEEGIPVVSPGSIIWGELDLVSPKKRVTEEEYLSLMNHCTPKLGDLVFSRNQSLGIASYVANDNKFVLGQDTVLIQSNEDSYFIFHYLQSRKTQNSITRLSGGSTFSRINLKDIRELNIAYPCKDEQQKIATFLNSVDDKLNKLRCKRERLKTYKRSLMQKLFLQEVRFKQTDGSYFPDWKSKKLTAVAEIIGGGTPETSIKEYWNGHIDWFTPTEIKSKYLLHSKRKISTLGLNKSSAKLLPAGTLLLSTRATVGDIGIAGKQCATNQGFQSLLIKKGNSNEFWYYWVIFNKKLLMKWASGSTFLEISKSEISKLPVLIPVEQEQQKIASCLSSLDKKIEAVSEQITQMETFKQGLLQKMFV